MELLYACIIRSESVLIKLCNLVSSEILQSKLVQAPGHEISLLFFIQCKGAFALLVGRPARNCHTRF